MYDIYFPQEQGIGSYTNYNNQNILKTIAYHFMGNHPNVPFHYKIDFPDGILCNEKGIYHFDFLKYFPDSNNEEYCFAKGKLFSFHDRIANFQISPLGSTTCRVNSEQVYNSKPGEEGERQNVIFSVSLKKGWNLFEFSTQKSERGFGFKFGNTMPQWEPYLFYNPLPKRIGHIGFAYSLPNENESEEKWYPEYCTTTASTQIAVHEIYPNDTTGYVYAKAKIEMEDAGILHVKGKVLDALNLWIDGVNQKGEKQREETLYKISKGTHSILVEIKKEKDIYLEYDVYSKQGKLAPAEFIQGYNGIWVYLGVLESKQTDIAKLMTMDYLKAFGDAYWKTGIKNSEIRVCVDSELFGRWTYPMGVTLYGMIKTAQFLKDSNMELYIKSDIEQILKNQRYAEFDKKRFGFPSINQQICWLSELDDCGSFGSCMLECYKKWPNESSKRMADKIADFMEKKQKRESDFAFSRNDGTMWIDDLYMSVPFLVRYYQLTGQQKYVDDACNQFISFKKRFYIQEKKLMSHIYDTRWKCANGIPWSRGNGWVLFSLSELLEVLPKTHKDYSKLIDFFNDLAEGMLLSQGTSGMWHQVLDDKSTYEESSSTAMFIVSFSRGIRKNYIRNENKNKIRNCIKKAWRGLIDKAVDCDGNVYGVCQGSGCSFSREYYQKLGWKYNDAHGIGIILLAGVEYCNA